MSAESDYQKGYAAGRRKAEKDYNATLERLGTERYERIFMQCLNTVVAHCGPHWKVHEEKVDCAERYCELAKIFADSSIEIMDDNL